MRWLAGVALLSLCLQAQESPDQKKLDIESFEKVWTTVRDKHWEKNPGGLDWNAIHAEFRPKIEKADSIDAARAVMREMLGRLKETHFAIFPATVYEDVDIEAQGEGSPGIDVRVLSGRAIVTDVDPGSPAEKAGVKPGWAVETVDGKPLGVAIEKLSADPNIHELTLQRAILARLSGPVGGTLHASFIDGANQSRKLDLKLVEPRGNPSKFGNLPNEYVWFESKKFGNTGYVRFNLFLDLMRIMGEFSKSIDACLHCDGFIIDLRGNPGGIGGMAMGMAGFLVNKPDQRLGAMYLRDSKLNFVINPRANVFEGPVAVLVDGCSASTSEILAGGLKDLGRARIFGTRTAAAALPSMIEKLPNGDGFQYAVANYISEGGQALEGNGVIPDTEVKLTREALLAGHDPVIDSAIDWIQKQRTNK
jgi:carboxyl-terminal processing protease